MSFQPGLFDFDDGGMGQPVPTLHRQQYPIGAVVYAPYFKHAGYGGREAWLTLEWTVRLYSPMNDQYLLYPLGMPREHKWFPADWICAKVNRRLMHRTLGDALEEIKCSQ